MAVMGFTYGDWATDTTGPEMAFATLVRDDGAEMRGGRTLSQRNTGSDSDLYFPESSYPYTKVRAPRNVAYPTAYQAWTWVTSPALPGPSPYQPFDEMSGTTGAVGWQNQGGPVQLVESRCDLLGDDGSDTYDAWEDAGGPDTFTEWFRTAYDPYTDGRIGVYIVGGLPRSGWSNQFKVGGLAAGDVVQADYPPGSGGYHNYIYPKDSDAVPQGGGTVPITGASDVQLYVDIGSEPPLVTVPGCPPGVVPALRHEDIPPPTFPAVGDTAFESSVTAVVWYEGTAVYRPWRLVFLAPVTSAVPLRQTGRTDGLLGAPRQVGSQQSLRQVQVVR